MEKNNLKNRYDFKNKGTNDVYFNIQYTTNIEQFYTDELVLSSLSF